MIDLTSPAEAEDETMENDDIFCIKTKDMEEPKQVQVDKQRRRTRNDRWQQHRKNKMGEMNNQSEQSYGDLKTQLNFINFPEEMKKTKSSPQPTSTAQVTDARELITWSKHIKFPKISFGNSPTSKSTVTKRCSAQTTKPQSDTAQSNIATKQRQTQRWKVQQLNRLRRHKQTTIQETIP